MLHIIQHPWSVSICTNFFSFANRNPVVANMMLVPQPVATTLPPLLSVLQYFLTLQAKTMKYNHSLLRDATLCFISASSNCTFRCSPVGNSNAGSDKLLSVMAQKLFQHAGWSMHEEHIYFCLSNTMSQTVEVLFRLSVKLKMIDLILFIHLAGDLDH